MYTHFYNLTEPAFAFRPQSSFFWLSEDRKAHLQHLEEGIVNKEAFLLLTGEKGTGKTTLLRQFLTRLKEDIVVARISGAGDSLLEFYNSIASGFGITKEIGGKVEFVLELSQLLKVRAEGGKKSLLIIDDGHQLEQEELAELRMLLGVEKEGKSLLTLLLVGEPKIVEFLANPSHWLLRQKLWAHIELFPLNHTETQSYIKHRLQAAGGSCEIFESEAFEVISDSAKGLPEGINTLCTNILNAAAKQGLEIISSSFISRFIARGENTLPAEDVTLLQEKRDVMKESRQSVAHTAASVAAAVESAVGGFPADDFSHEKADYKNWFRWKRLWLFRRLALVVSLCIGLYFLFEYILFAVIGPPANEVALPAKETSVIEQAGPPLVSPSKVLPKESNFIRINPLQFDQSVPPSSEEGVADSGEKKKENGGRILLQPLQVIDSSDD